MNVFGFNDDLNLDDRIIIQNATENQIYNLVERPKFLLTFELKDSEQEFLYTISKQEARKTTMYLALLILLNKIVIFSDSLQDGNLEVTTQFYLMFFIFLFEITLIYKLNNPTYDMIHFWTYMLLIYGIMVLAILLSYQVKYLGQWTIAGFNELQIQLTISLIFFMRNVLLRHYIITYAAYMFAWILVVIMMAKQFEYQIIQFILGQVMYSLLLAVGIHHREMIQRKSLNYERILNVEIDKTNVLISKLVPLHILNVIKNEKRQVDEFDQVCLLYTDIIKFNEFTKKYIDPREAVQVLNKVFTRFDQLCEEYKVYKVHTIGDCYVIMAYNGKIEKSKRTKNVIIEETSRMLNLGLNMVEILGELKQNTKDSFINNINVRIGLHTGPVIAGIIGSRMVKYDIFGEGVLIANKLKRHALENKVCISEDTKKTLMGNPEIANEFYYTDAGSFPVKPYNRTIKFYHIERKKTESLRDGFSSAEHAMSDGSEMYSARDLAEESQTSRSHASNNSLVPKNNEYYN